MINKKFLSFALLFILLFFIKACAFISIPLTSSVKPFQEEIISGSGDNKILILDISGIISQKKNSDSFSLVSKPNMVSRIKEELEKAGKDKKIKAIILTVDSPGGTVTASDIIYNELMTLKRKTGIKIIASMMDIAASGGYYVSMAADKIIAHPTTITGSIGVILINLNISDLMKKVGIRNETIKSGNNKDILSPFKPLTDEERKILQQVIDTLQDQFINVVLSSRKDINIKQIRKIADGRIYTAKEALRLNLIDKIGYIDDALELAKKEAGLQEAKVIRYNRPFTYVNNIYSKYNSSTTTINYNKININAYDFLGELTPRFMYLWMN